MMTNAEAYGNRSYDERAATQYQPGDLVTVGPAYRMGGTYQADGCEGSYVVVKSLGSSDYKVARGDVVTDYDLIIHASRLTLR